VEAHSVFSNYNATLPADSSFRQVLGDERPVVLAIVLVSSEWQKSSVNLRAPLFISAKAMRGAQVVLADTNYGVAELLPLEQAAA
jgi:flagellar assembly factor FliW